MIYIGRTPWADRKGRVWQPASGPRAEPGWLFCDDIAGTICFERGRWACYRLNDQKTPCAIVSTIEEAAAFMERPR